MQNSVESSKRKYDLVLASADYPARLGPPTHSLIICTQQRAGSTLLGEAIYFAGGLGCPLEYFHGGFRASFEARWKPADLRAYVATLHHHRTDPSGVFSVKLFWRDIVALVREYAPAEFEALHARTALRISPESHRRMFEIVSELLPNPLFVLLTRRDKARQAVSLMIAGRTRGWRLFHKYNGEGRPKVDYDFDEVVHLLAAIQSQSIHWLDFFRANDLKYIEISYEEIEQDYEGALRNLFTALGKPNAPITPPRLQKQADVFSDEILERFLTEFRQRSRGA